MGVKQFTDEEYQKAIKRFKAFGVDKEIKL